MAAVATDFRVGVTHRLFHAEMVKRRKERGLTQRDIADACAVNIVKLGEIEQLKRWPDPDLAGNIASQLDCDVYQLFPPWMKERVAARLPTSVTTEHLLTVESLDTPAMLALPSGETLESADDAAFKDQVKTAVGAALQTLTARQRRVLTLRYGLDGNPPQSIEEVGKAFVVTRERIRQIERKALQRLRSGDLLAPLVDGMSDAGRPLSPYWKQRIETERLEERRQRALAQEKERQEAVRVAREQEKQAREARHQARLAETIEREKWWIEHREEIEAAQQAEFERQQREVEAFRTTMANRLQQSHAAREVLRQSPPDRYPELMPFLRPL